MKSRDEWRTPPEFIAAVYDVMGGIDLDPASSAKANETVGATTYFDKKKCGLMNDWFGRVYLNPPYSQPSCKCFVSKAIEEYTAGRAKEIVALFNASTSAQWFHRLLKKSTISCLVKGRIAFIDDDDVQQKQNRNSQAVFYFGENPRQFMRVFQSNNDFCFREVSDEREYL